MKKWAFVSDFDGTISQKDFYWLVIEQYFPEGHELFKQWKAGELLDIDFLQRVFRATSLTEEELLREIERIPLDPDAIPLLKEVREAGADVYILSAGTDYYIRHLLRELDDVTILSNRGEYESGGIGLKLDPAEWSYSERYGIDKRKVVERLKESYETVHFAGDSEPDSHPAHVADRTFAKDALQTILQQQGVDFEPVESFRDIRNLLIKSGWLS